MSRAVLAEVYIGGGKNVAWPSGPGRTIPFRGGHAHIIDERDIPAALKIEGAIVDIPKEQIDWLPKWVEMLGPACSPKAEIRVPDGFVVGSDYQVTEVPSLEAMIEEDKKYEDEKPLKRGRAKSLRIADDSWVDPLLGTE